MGVILLMKVTFVIYSSELFIFGLFKQGLTVALDNLRFMVIFLSLPPMSQEDKWILLSSHLVVVMVIV